MISSTTNGQIKNLIQLQKKSRARVETGTFVIEGIKMFEESRDLGHLIKAYVSERFYENKIATTPYYFKEVPYEIVSEHVLNEAAETKTPQGIMATVKMPSYSIDDMIKNKATNLVLLEDIRDPGNLGTIVRTAEGAGFTGIILSKTSVDMYNPKVIRSTMGAIYRMPFIYVEDFIDTLQLLKENEITLYAAHLKGQQYYDEVEYEDKCAIMIGNEANGLSNESAALASKYIKIPMCGQVESLNAAVASAILMYEIYKRRRNK